MMPPSYLNNIDDKIMSLRQDMNTSLLGVERNLHGVAKQLFTMLTQSLKDLVDNQQYKASKLPVGKIAKKTV